MRCRLWKTGSSTCSGENRKWNFSGDSGVDEFSSFPQIIFLWVWVWVTSGYECVTREVHYDVLSACTSDPESLNCVNLRANILSAGVWGSCLRLNMSVSLNTSFETLNTNLHLVFKKRKIHPKPAGASQTIIDLDRRVFSCRGGTIQLFHVRYRYWCSSLAYLLILIPIWYLLFSSSSFNTAECTLNQLPYSSRGR